MAKVIEITSEQYEALHDLGVAVMTVRRTVADDLSGLFLVMYLQEGGDRSRFFRASKQCYRHCKFFTLIDSE